jgi:NAD(P)-dependent dehydrogenase (short-subunit alcohol dehydrogenase family)
MTKVDCDLDINVNLMGQMNVAQSVIPHMIARKYGRVVNTTGGRSIPTISVYGAAKAGVVAWTHTLAAEVAQFGVIVNGIAPGLGETGLTNSTLPAFIEPYGQRLALKRLCRPEDVGPTVAFVASDLCSYMVGQFYRSKHPIRGQATSS